MLEREVARRILLELGWENAYVLPERFQAAALWSDADILEFMRAGGYDIPTNVTAINGAAELREILEDMRTTAWPLES